MSMPYNVEINNLATEFCKVTHDHFESHSYAAGYFVSLLSQVFDRLPAEVQLTTKLALEGTIEVYSQNKGLTIWDDELIILE